jgi:hypothetical protein
VAVEVPEVASNAVGEVQVVEGFSVVADEVDEGAVVAEVVIGVVGVDSGVVLAGVADGVVVAVVEAVAVHNILLFCCSAMTCV